MDSSSLKKQYICNSSINQSTPSIMVSKCPCHCFGIIPGPHDFISMNSIELNNGASISDDSGVPLTTNSSISSCDSFRIGMCKYEMEMAESDGEASQFDSLENCSESGMSAENFNTLKKGPLVPIDPPPEFQDSPQITPIPSLSDSISKKIRRWSLSQSTFEYTKEGSGNLLHNTKIDKTNLIKNANKSIGELYSVNKHLYSSDSILNILNDNIYDEPNNIISTSMGTSIDIIDSDCSSIPIHLVSTPKNCNRPIHPSNQEYSRYFKAIPSDQDNLVTAAQMDKQEKLSVIHQYGLYYGTTKNFTYQYDNNLQRKVLQSPLKHIYQYNRHHNHTGISSSGNRPHSRNSFNGRLSSSHNSLGVSKTNKADDSIFITQAMSHDALLTCDISDFYNVPIDSDIYAFPIDMIKPDIENKKITDFAKKAKEIRIIVQSDDVSTDRYYKCPNQKSLNKNSRIKRRKRLKNDFSDMHTTFKDQNEVLPANTNKTFKENLNNEGKPHEPLHMSLQEVKHFYHSFYADLHDDTNNRSEYIPKLRTLSSNKSIWNSKPNCKTKINKENTIKRSLEIKVNAAKNNKLDSHNENINNNNNNTTVVNHNNYQHKYPKISNIIGHHLQHHQTSKLSKFSATNNKLILQTDKKSQFALNFKQKFCSIFRFGKNNRCRENSTGSSEYITNTMHTSNQALTTEDKGSKFQSRALPPLPKKADTKDDLSCGRADRSTEFKSYHFTSSIEKVKDYGWYWGPLSSEAAEKVLSNEPDGSFIVRDSSDHHYIFSLSFKLNSCVRHVRIEQDQGTFSFGSYAKFKSQTITEFIEKAVEHSRSGRYLFFLHRRPEHGPLRVQLTNPVSRFKHVQSLQHMCRFIIVKAVIRKDLIQTLPLPRRLLDYLNYKHCYSEQVESDNSQISGDASTT